MSKFVELSLEAINHFKTISKILGEESEDLNPFHLSYDTEYERLNSFIFTYLDKDFWPKNTQVPKETRNYIDNEIKQFNPELAQQIKSEMANWGRVLTDDERKSLAAYRAVGSLIKNFFSQVKDVVQEIVEIKNKTDIILSEAILAAKHGLCEAGSLALNDYRDFYELVEGKDYCSGKELTLFERTVSSFGLLLGQGKWWREGFAAIGAIAVGKKTNALVNSARKLGVRTSEGIKDFADLSKRIVGNDIGAVGDLSKIIKGKMTRFNPIKRGPLSDIPIGSGKTVADTFRSSSYFETLTEAPVKLYRVHGDGASPMSKYWSRTKPTGPVQAVLDSALDPDWGNTAKKWVEITVPKGTKIYEGIVSEVALKRGSRQVSTGQLLGGGSQVYINKKAIPDSWITNRGDF
jgi:hypothetical protein